MRCLAVNEMQMVSGAGYAEDILATAATLYVAGQISAFTSGFVGTSFSMMSGMVGTLSGIAPLAAGVGTVGSILTPIAALAAPFAIGAYMLDANPGMTDALIGKYHSYFG